jgi:hypothetical protein
MLFLAALALVVPFAVSKDIKPEAHGGFNGIWNSATATPLERPTQLKDKAFFTAAEAAEWERDVAERNQEPSPETVSKGTGTYNTFYREFGTRTVKTLRTSIITDRRMAAFLRSRLRPPTSSSAGWTASGAPRTPRIWAFRINASPFSQPGRRCCRIPTTATTRSCRPGMHSSSTWR